MTEIRTSCPMDCYAHCGLVAHLEQGQITKITGDTAHPLNQGLICNKGRSKHLQRLYNPNRITEPLRKVNGAWQPIDWTSAYKIIAEQLLRITGQHGPLAVLHHDGAGSEGLLKGLSERFFDALGGCTTPAGSICWGSGYQAQTYDFGQLQLHSWEDVLNSRLIILWGRDPAVTNIQMMPLLQSAKKQGARVIVINPLRVASCSLADLHLAPRPGSDGALALGLAHLMIKNNWHNQNYINQHVYGYQAFLSLVEDYTPERVASITGLSAGEIIKLAQEYSTSSPSCILLGYGLQRYTNGGQTVRAIDALAAISGNIGVPGGGVNYGGGHWKGMFAPIKKSGQPSISRSLPWPTLADAILEANDPPIKSIFVTRSNPLTQLPDLNKVLQAFNKSEFTVVVDMFLTDTAKMADLFLPCTTFLEAGDVIYNSWNHYLSYAPKVVEPVGQCRPDQQIFSDLAQHMGLAGFPRLTDTEWINLALAPLSSYGINLDKLIEGPVRHPLAPNVPWQDGNFPTPSGKFELYSQLAEEDGVNPLPAYVEPMESPLRDAALAKQYPLHLITAHHPDYLHSQFWNLTNAGQSKQQVYLHPTTAQAAGIQEKMQVEVSTRRGKAIFQAAISDRLRTDTILIYQGHWTSHGNGVNLLTAQKIPDMGLGTPYYDCLCRVTPV